MDKYTFTLISLDHCFFYLIDKTHFFKKKREKKAFYLIMRFIQAGFSIFIYEYV